MDDPGSAAVPPASTVPANAGQPPHTPYRPWLHAFAISVVITTFCLIALGGAVTSKGAGLAVPDWPTTYDRAMFAYPLHKLQGGEWWEHTHRMLGSIVGLQVLILAGWVWLTQTHRDGLRWLGMASVALVIVQGLMGGLRVTEVSIALAIIHGITGQLFFCCIIAITAATSRWWLNQINTPPAAAPARAGGFKLSLLLLAVLFVQLCLGAGVRHTNSGLAIPDFPSHYGGVLPPMSKSALAQVFAEMPQEEFTQEYSMFQVHLHFGHRLWALIVVAVVVAAVTRVGKHHLDAMLRRPAAALALMTLTQFALGAIVIWTGRHPEAATAHQALGAAVLGVAALLAMRLGRANIPTRAGQGARAAQTTPPASSGLQGAQA